MVHNFTYYVPMIFSILLFTVTWKIGDWRNWKKYYPTILFTVCVDFFISIIMYEHTLWFFHKAFLAPNHTTADFLIAFTNLPCIVLLFLSFYPLRAKLLKQLGYLFFWTILFSIIELVFLKLKLMSYHNGWNFLWTVIVWAFIFLGILVHYKKPLFAWVICFICTIILIIYFQIPITKMK